MFDIFILEFFLEPLTFMCHLRQKTYKEVRLVTMFLTSHGIIDKNEYLFPDPIIFFTSLDYHMI